VGTGPQENDGHEACRELNKILRTKEYHVFKANLSSPFAQKKSPYIREKPDPQNQ
jgi:hypothetical protein